MEKLGCLAGSPGESAQMEGKHVAETILAVVLFTLLVISGTAAVLFRQVINSVISLSIFSVTLAAVFLMYQAPDVAMAEAVVGAGLMTALFLVTISRTQGGDH